LNIELFHQETQAVCPPLLLERAGEAIDFDILCASLSFVNFYLAERARAFLRYAS